MASSSSHQRNEERNAFYGIEPAREIRRVPESSRLFDVFINHRGPDVKTTLATQLYNSLEQLGIRTFLDSQEKELGISFPYTIETAIFSKRYAESAWCLAELVLMLQSAAKIIPVFYEVQPWELRHIEKGVYAEAFINYEEKGRYLEKLREWKDALHCLSYTAGEVFNSFSGWDCQKIVAAVQKEVQRKIDLHVADYPVGLNNFVEDFEKLCFDEFVQKFENQCRLEEGEHKDKVVGIFGMPGSGKTTLAKELFNRKKYNYFRASFLFDVREQCVKSKFHRLQRQLLKDLYGQDLSIKSIEEGTSYLKDCLERNPFLSFLIVVDDVDDVKQLNALQIMDILNRSCNSLVIVTTRDSGVLITAGITVAYNLKAMNRNYGRELFCWHAFGQPHPHSGYEKLVNSFVELCGGLPLSLQVLGRHVHGKTKDYWNSELIKVSKMLPWDVNQRLKVSLAELDVKEKQVFMDIACFFIGKPKSIAERVWGRSGWNAQHALRTLKDKRFVEETEIWGWNGEATELRMHDHLRDLGRELALELSPPRRLWRPQDLKSLELSGFKTILTQTNVRCFHSIFDESMGSQVTFFLGQSDICAERPASLLWLQLEGNSTEQSSIPSWIPLQNLQCLKVKGGRFKTLWKNCIQPPLQLRELRITQCFRGSSLPEEFCDLQLLEHLELSQCPILSSLPHRFGDLKNLRYVELSNCRQLEELPHSFGQLIRLKYLILSCCWKLKLRLDMLKNITTLEYLNLTRCHELEELPRQITNQASLTRLFVEGTGMRDVPTNICELGNLEELRIGSPTLTSLPSSLGNLSYLNSLLIDGCPQLENLPQSLCLLDLLKQVRIRASGLKQLPFGSAGSSNFEVTSRQASNSAYNLRPSITENCLQTLWNALQSLWIERRITEHESLQTYFPNKLPASLETLSLVANPQLMEIPILPQSLNILEICVCKMLKNMRGIAGLVKLRRLVICSCPELDELPSFADLASLEEFKIQGCPKVKIIQGLENCKSLQVLTAEVPLILTCDTISAFKPCILSMKTYPWEMMIRGRVTHRVKPIVDSWSLPSLTVLQLEKDSDWDNITQDLFNTGFLWYEEEKESNNEESGSSGVKVVHIAVCSEGSAAFPEYCVGRRLGSNPNVKQRKAILATGEGEIVAVAFLKLIKLLK